MQKHGKIPLKSVIKLDDDLNKNEQNELNDGVLLT